VSRNPRKVNDTDSLVSANLLDVRLTAQAVKVIERPLLTVSARSFLSQSKAMESSSIKA